MELHSPVKDMDIHPNRPCIVQLSRDQIVVRQTDINRHFITVQQLQVRIAELEDLLSQKGVQLQQERVRNDILSDSVEQLESENRNLQDQLSLNQTVLQRAETNRSYREARQFHDQICQLEDLLSQSRTQMRQVIERNEALTQAEQKLKAENRDLMIQLGSQVPELRQALYDEQMKVNKLEEDLKEKDKKVKQIEQEVDRLRSQNQLLSRRIVPLTCTETNNRKKQKFDHMNDDLECSFKFPSTEEGTNVDLHKLGRFQVSTRPFECRQCHEAFKSWADMKRSSCRYHPSPRMQVNTPGGRGKTYLWICCSRYDSTGRMIPGCQTGNHISCNASSNRDERARAGIARASS